jgi:hypothetical protein
MFLIGLVLYLLERNKSAQERRFGCLSSALMVFSGVPMVLVVLAVFLPLFVVGWVIDGLHRFPGGIVGAIAATLVVFLIIGGIRARREPPSPSTSSEELKVKILRRGTHPDPELRIRSTPRSKRSPLPASFGAKEGEEPRAFVRKCPHCSEYIIPKATTCSFCGNEVPPL